MISEGRLEELIKQGATIWTINKSGNINAVKTNKTCEIQGQFLMKERQIYSYIEKAFETKEEAEFYKNYKNILSVHILDLPSWEELQKTACFYFQDYYGEDCIMRDDVDEIAVEGTIDNEPYRRELATWTFPRTEDGYLSACEICKKLFLGEIDD